MRGLFGLFEGAATGAEDGYARMAGKPVCALLHLGPGLANGLANLKRRVRQLPDGEFGPKLRHARLLPDRGCGLIPQWRPPQTSN